MNMDRIIARFVPIVVAILFTVGLGYLIYTNVWPNVSYTLRIAVGTFASVLIIGLGYSIQEKIRFYADVVIGAGILLFYGTLIYASRTTDTAAALLPEQASIVVALAFTAVTAYFATERQSKAIFVLSLVGAYLTPFVIGQEASWTYAISYNSYLLYFFAVNLSIFALSRRIWLGDIVPLNALGLLIGITTLHSVAYGTLPAGPGVSFFASDSMTAIIYALIVGTYVVATVLNSSKFPEKYSEFVPFGYLAPLVWFALAMGMLTVPSIETDVLYAILALMYFICWHMLRDEKNQDMGHAFLYAGGIVSISIVIFHLCSESTLYLGFAMSGVSLAFGILSMLKPVTERIIAYIGIGFLGSVIVGSALMVHPSARELIAGSTHLTLIASLIPLLFSWALYGYAGDFALRDLTRFVGSFAAIGILLTLLSYLTGLGVSPTIIFCTLPALLCVGYLSFEHGSFHRDTVSTAAMISIIALVVGYFETFFALAGRLYPFPTDISFFNEAAFIGLLSTIGFFVALSLHRTLEQTEEFPKPSFPLVMLAYSGLLLVVNNEFLALFNTFHASNGDFMQGIRAVLTTLWWVVVAGWMIFTGVKHPKTHQPEKILGLLLLGLTVLKILFYDLSSVSTQMKIIVLMVVGGGLMMFSYSLSQKGLLHIDDEQPSEKKDELPPTEQ